MPVDLTTAGKDAFYEIADALYAKKELLEKALRDREVTLFKERAINTLCEKRFLEALSRLQRSVAKGSILLPEKIAQRLGRLKERHPAAARPYEITMEVADKKVTGVKAVKKPAEKDDLNGCYVIETSHQNMTAKEIWEAYMTFTQVEGAFRALKTALGVRPVYHQIAERTKAHLFISVPGFRDVGKRTPGNLPSLRSQRPPQKEASPNRIEVVVTK